MVVKKYTPHLYLVNNLEQDTLKMCVHHLNPRYTDKNVEEYRDYYHQYTPHVDIATLDYKLNEAKNTNQLILIEPEMRWLFRGLKEMIDLALTDTENGDFALDYVDTELQLLIAFKNTLGESVDDELITRYENACESFSYTPIEY